ncbi:hypothetical protein THS5294_02724 [Thalassobacter stenotrophicus]|uniref:Uncharacterized protein n=1 Tax=Thalassobacter stenotrophicus TaxID=266809 RepID=A0A0P1FJT7_9RHOB|nr:hypothetical protein THS5294_02724 [Thalassobacter stenotrophicus]
MAPPFFYCKARVLSRWARACWWGLAQGPYIHAAIHLDAVLSKPASLRLFSKQQRGSGIGRAYSNPKNIRRPLAIRHTRDVVMHRPH